jgi:Raf kinase inhibitor-like YbhB/YbcL family protein
VRLLLVPLALLLAGCASPAPQNDSTPAPGSAGPLTIASSAFQDGATLPKDFTCDGAGTSPPLRIAGVPAEAAEVALVVGDPDAPLPQAPQQNFTHWAVWHLAPVAGVVTFDAGKPPAGAREGQSSGGGNGWTPPCPPQYSTAHRYVFTAYAMRAPLDVPAGATRAQLDAAMQGKVLAQASMQATYMRAITRPWPQP